MHHVFNGTLPVRPYHPTQFFGTIKADGQLPKVAALACYHQEVVAISLVGYDTSVSAALARLWQREQLAFEVDPTIDWHGQGSLVAGRRTTNSFNRCCLQRKKSISWRSLPQQTLPKACFIPRIYRNQRKSKDRPLHLYKRRREIFRVLFWVTGTKTRRICAVSWGICMPCA